MVDTNKNFTSLLKAVITIVENTSSKQEALDIITDCYDLIKSRNSLSFVDYPSNFFTITPNDVHYKGV